MAPILGCTHHPAPPGASPGFAGAGVKRKIASREYKCTVHKCVHSAAMHFDKCNGRKVRRYREAPLISGDMFVRYPALATPVRFRLPKRTGCGQFPFALELLEKKP